MASRNSSVVKTAKKPKTQLQATQQRPDARAVSEMITWMVSPYTLVLLILLDFAYLLIEVLSLEFLPLEFFLYMLAGITGAMLVFASEFLTNKNTVLKEKAAVALIGGVITALPFPVLGVGTGLVGLAFQYLARKQQGSN